MSLHTIFEIIVSIIISLMFLFCLWHEPTFIEFEQDVKDCWVFCRERNISRRRTIYLIFQAILLEWFGNDQ